MEKTNVEQETSIKPTKWRFVVLWLTWCYTFLTAFQFVQYIMVPDVLIEFFDVKNNHVSWTATIMNTGTGFKLKKTEILLDEVKIKIFIGLTPPFRGKFLSSILLI